VPVRGAARPSGWPLACSGERPLRAAYLREKTPVVSRPAPLRIARAARDDAEPASIYPRGPGWVGPLIGLVERIRVPTLVNRCGHLRPCGSSCAGVLFELGFRKRYPPVDQLPGAFFWHRVMTRFRSAPRRNSLRPGGVVLMAGINPTGLHTGKERSSEKMVYGVSS